MSLVAGLRQLSYLTMRYSQATISTLTGIPRSTIGYAVRGERAIPFEYRSALRNLYQRTTYDVLRDMGMSAGQARRFQWYAPETVMVTEGEMASVVDFLSEGVMASKLRVTLRDLGYSAEQIKDLTFDAKIRIAQVEGQVDMTRLWNEAREVVKGGLRKSHKTFEEWEAYGF